jgi:hypothetical protein
MGGYKFEINFSWVLASPRTGARFISTRLRFVYLYWGAYRDVLCAVQQKVQGGNGLVLHGLRTVVLSETPQRQVFRQRGRSSLPRSQPPCPVCDCGGQHAAEQHATAVCPMALRIL